LSVFTTSFNAELAAIKQALQYTSPFDWLYITILTDSKSAIQAISSFKWEYSSLITEILNIITNLKSAGTQITFVWIPSHAGIHGNEVADELANKNRTDPDGLVLEYTSNISEKLTKLKSKHIQSTFEKIKSSPTNLAILHRTNMKPILWFRHNNRRIQVALLRLRCGHNRLNHCVNKWIESSNCPNACVETENNTHVLITCPHYSRARTPLKNLLASLQLPLDVPTITGMNNSIPKHTQQKIESRLIKFLIETNLVNRL
jgi:ribonuclease HI